MTSLETPRGTTRLNYNLVSQPAVELTDLEGGRGEVTLEAAVLDAHRFGGLVTRIPTAVPSLLRQVFVPILLHSLGKPDPDVWEERFRRGSFSTEEQADIAQYFEDHQDRFWLFGDTDRPFAQTPGLESLSGEVKPVSVLLPHITSGNGVPLFTPFTDGSGPVLAPIEAFEAVLHCLDWDTAALKTGAAGDPKVTGGTTKANPTGNLGFLGVTVPLGTTFFHTLMLNVPADWGGLRSGDLPQWARKEPPGPTWTVRPSNGLMDHVTWPSRRIRLVAQERPTGPVVTGAVCTAGDRRIELPEEEPHTLWKRSPDKRLKGRFMPMRHRSGKAAWRSLDALLALSHDDTAEVRTSVLLDQAGVFVREGRIPIDYPLRVAVFGLEYGTQSAVITNAIVDEMPLPVAALTSYDSFARSSVLEAVEQADRLRLSLDRYQNDLREASGGDKLTWDKGSHTGAEFIAALDLPIRRLLAGFQSAGEDTDLIEAGMRAWEQILWSRGETIAAQLLESASPESFIAIASKTRTRTASPVARADRLLKEALSDTLTRESKRRNPPRQGDQQT